MNKEHFELKPLKGYGLFNLGMTIEEAKAHAEIYGGVKYTGPLYTDRAWDETKKILRDTGVSEEEIAETEKELQGAFEEQKKHFKISFENDVICFFDDNGLYNIRILSEKTPVFFAGESLYDLPGEKAVRLVAEGVQENPYMKEGGAFFIKHSFVLGEFFSDMRAGYPIWTSPHQPRQRNVFINDMTDPEDGYDLEEAVLFKAI